MARKISADSELKVETWLRALAPKAATASYIRGKTMIGNKSVRIICEQRLADRVEVIESTAGRLYRWKAGAGQG